MIFDKIGISGENLICSFHFVLLFFLIKICRAQREKNFYAKKSYRCFSRFSYAKNMIFSHKNRIFNFDLLIKKLKGNMKNRARSIKPTLNIKKPTFDMLKNRPIVQDRTRVAAMTKRP